MGAPTTVAQRNHAALTTTGVAHQPTTTNQRARVRRERWAIVERDGARGKG
jgi:hypothetical protein